MSNETKQAGGIITLPMLALRELVVFPKVAIHFDVSRDKSVKSLTAAAEGGKLIFLTAQIDNDEEVTPDRLYTTGVVAEVKQLLRTPGGVTRVMAEGLYRAKLVDIVGIDPYYTARVKKYPERVRAKTDPLEMEALVRAVKEEFKAYCSNIPRVPGEYISSIIGSDDPKTVFDNIAVSVPLPVEEKQQLLEANGTSNRLSMLLAMLSRETEIMGIEREIQEKLRQQVDESQREYYLREQMKAISRELGEDDSVQDEAYEYLDKIYALKLPHETEEKLVKEADRLSRMSSSSQEAFVVRNYLDTCLDLPWNNATKDKNDIKRAEKVLNKDHYGLEKVKERILESMAVRQLAPDVKGQILCLYGPPGVGKTSVAKSIARSLGRKYVRISLGGVRDEADIRGHRKTYVGAMPGRIINALIQAGTKNPVILLDEIDKISGSQKGDPSAALLEVLDSEQNTAFRDHYVEVPFDLGDVMFITTANDMGTVDPPLRDRMEVIELGSYTREEKFHIAKEHLVPKQIKKHGLKASQLRINDKALYAVIDGYTREAGVRGLERYIAKICRKAAKEIVEETAVKVSITPANTEKYLGHRKYHDDSLFKMDQVGVVNGLAWTSAGGVIMPLEVLVMDGKGTVEATGSLGDVMKESSKLAVSFVRSIAADYGIDGSFYKEKDVHIHAPEGATPKDGPSAGVTMTTALVSALSGIPVRRDVAMTGEITLHGKVLPIGGLREKTMAAYKEGMKTVIIPEGNRGDMDEVDEAVKSGLDFVFAEKITDVLDVALAHKPKQKLAEKKVAMPFAAVADEDRVPLHSRKKGAD
ncbi:MAG: endopeptidase La [Oscillospiraceae bacterium]|nr:endopeptidase La [Oscillospiraceae bacterium]